jgi:hypothetical protein
VANGLDDVAGTGFALGADHGRALGDAAEGFAEIAAAADEGNAEGVLVYMVDSVGWGKNLRFVDVVYTEGFEDLRWLSDADTSRSYQRECQLKEREAKKRTWHSTK